MNAEIIAVGTEILLGNIVNTNAQYLSEKLSELGINVYYQSVVGDNPDRLKSCLKQAMERADLLLITGGLGPTQDDLTKETAAELMGFSLEMHEPSLERMRAYFQAVNRPMTPNNKKQAMMPKGATVLKNDCGTAPGCMMERDGKIMILLPGPPIEMKTMYEGYVRPLLLQKSDSVISSRTMRLFGIGESRAESLIADLIRESENPSIAPYAKLCEVHLRLTAKAETEEKAEQMLDETEGKVSELLGQYCYGYDEDTLQTVAVHTLMEQGKTLAVAESCTGGMIAKMITEVSGSSRVFTHGFVTYANEAKEQMLGVKHSALERFGAVSETVAMQMCRGAKEKSGADFALSVTGIAGPGGGTDKKPVGLVYIGLATSNGVRCKKLLLSGSRDKIRTQTAMNALAMLLEELK
ncbi:MAG: competence/damage-inducible protein A [Ruminococcaceae bacterium]|nr:competence/damage-inducible protein A [Oscillospiraceae bacterium]